MRTARGSLIYENDELRLEKMCLYKSQYCSLASRAVRLHAAEGASLFPTGPLADHLVRSCPHGLEGVLHKHITHARLQYQSPRLFGSPARRIKPAENQAIPAIVYWWDTYVRAITLSRGQFGVFTEVKLIQARVPAAVQSVLVHRESRLDAQLKSDSPPLR